MKENSVDQFLTKSLEYLSSAEAFLKAEMPEFIKELLAWSFYNAMFKGIILLVLFIGFAILSFTFYKKHLKKPVDCYDLGTFLIGGLAFIFIFGGLLVCQIQTMIKIKLAPRVFLIEQVRDLTRG